MTKTKGYIILAFIVITSLFIVCIFEIKDQYEDTNERKQAVLSYINS